jgi:hypothetical protein
MLLRSLKSATLGPFSGQAATFVGWQQSGGSSEALNGAFLVYRYRLQFPDVVQLNSISVSGAAFNGLNSVIRVLDSNRNVLATLATSGGNTYQSFTIPVNQQGTVFYLDEFDTSTTWRYRDHITVSATAGNQVQGNFIGTNAAGTAPLPNGGNGVTINNSAGNTVGGSAFASNLQAFYPFDGNFSDVSGRGNTGIPSSSPPSFVMPGYQSQAIQLNAANNQFVTAPVNISPAAMPQVTMGGWFNASTLVTSSGAIRGLISDDDGGLDRTIDVDTRGGGGLRWSAFTGSAILAGSPVVANQWTFVVVRYDQVAGTVILNVDGNEFSATGRVDSNSTNTTTIGRNPNFDFPFDGLIDNVFIYNMFLSDAQIAMIRAGGPPSATRVANIISGNVNNGILITGAGSAGNSVQSNYIGTNSGGASGLGNSGDGVQILNAPNNTIGGFGTGNSIAGNSGNGVNINGPGAVGNTVEGNDIGLPNLVINGSFESGDFSGWTLVTSNKGGGTHVDPAMDFAGVHYPPHSGTFDAAFGNPFDLDTISQTLSTVPGTTYELSYWMYSDGLYPNEFRVSWGGNILSDLTNVTGPGYRQYTFDVTATAATTNLQFGGFNGPGWMLLDDISVVPITGLANVANGVVIQGGANRDTIGGSVAGSRNVISGNAVQGIEITGAGTNNNVVEGNYIGTDVTGNARLGNLQTGVQIEGGAQSNRIGVNGADANAASEANVISANGIHGIVIRGANFNVVAGNFVGTNASGTAPLGNLAVGIALDGGSQGNLIGTNADGVGDALERNIVAGNGDSGVNMFGAGTNQNVVAGNYIGTDVSGSIAFGNGTDGVRIEATASNNSIGGTSAAARNLISGNIRNGVNITGAGTTGNVVEGNYIGTGITGTVALGNASDGVRIQGGASNNTIGGSTAAARNVISANAGNGIHLLGSGTNNNLVAGNFIGTDVAGSGPVGFYNGPLGNLGQGVQVDGGAANNTIGGLTATPGTGLGNVISGNHQRGIAFFGGSFNLVAGNIVGLNAAGSAILSNYFQGVEIGGSTGNTIGGTAAGARNIISGSGGGYGGVLIDTSTGILVQGNYIGTDITGTNSQGNAFGGIFIIGAKNNTIGGTTAAAENLISGNGNNGVYITDATNFYGTTGPSTGNVVQGNLIGTDLTGTAALANSQTGVLIVASSNTIGGTATGAGNVISGNARNGIDISAVGLTGTLFGGSGYIGATANVVQGNYIGTDRTGAAPLGNVQQGIIMEGGAANNTIGGLTSTPGTGPGNVVSANGYSGIVTFGSNGNLIIGNIAGLNAAGTALLSNVYVGAGFTSGSSFNTLGGTAAGSRNIVSGNNVSSQGGVFVGAGSSNNLVQGNFIGTDITGTRALGNAGDGVYIIGAINNTIGGQTTTAGNLISGNSHNGVHILNAVNFFGYTGPSTGNVVQGNFIGTDVTGAVALGNAGDGVQIEGGASNNTIGGTTAAAGNTIAFNTGAGVVVGASASDSSTIGNTIRANSIFSNGGLGIDLGNDGVTPNGMGAGIGPNDFLNFPVLVHATPGNSTEIVGTYSGLPNTLVTIDFYASPAADPSGYGEGKRYLGATTVVTNASGSASFDVILNASTVAGEFISATATDPGDTSEFSQAIQADTPPQVAFSAPTRTNVALTAPLTATIANLDPTLTYSYQWSLTFNGSPVALPNPSIVADNPTNEETFIFTPQQVGNYQVFLSVTDSRGGTGSAASGTITVGGTTIAVVLTGDPAGAPAPFTATTNQFLTLHSQLTDPLVTAATSKGQPPPNITYQYSWGVTLDGSPFTLPVGTITNADSFTFVPTQSGTYVVSLAVSDGQGGQGAGSSAILVSGAAPAVLIVVAPSTTVPEGTLVTLNTKVADATLGGQLTYNWTITPNNGQPIITEQDQNGSFTFNPMEEGQYQVLLTVTDSQGHMGIGSPVLVTAINTTPTVTINGVPLLNPPTGSSITLTGAVTDADPNKPGSGSADPYVLNWSVTAFNGGQSNPATGSGATFTFTPASADLYEVTLTAIDEKGLAVSTNVVISVTQVVLGMAVTPPTSPVEGTTFGWSATVAGPNSVGFHFIWQLTAPDGTTTTIDNGTTNGSSPNTLVYKPLLPGPYSVSVTATGSDGSVARAAPPATGTAITVANTGPQVVIIAPPPPRPAGFLEGDSITLTSTAIDPGLDLSNPIYS